MIHKVRGILRVGILSRIHCARVHTGWPPPPLQCPASPICVPNVFSRGRCRMEAEQRIQEKLLHRCRYRVPRCVVRCSSIFLFQTEDSNLPFYLSPVHRDTVSSVGLIPKRLPFTSSNYSIKTFRHAISLDEHRAKFKPNFYQRPTEKQQKLGMQPGEMPKSTVVVPYNTSSYGAVNGVPLKLQEVVNGEHKATHNTKKRLTEYEAAFDAATPGMVDATDVLEVWFAGCHCGTFVLFNLNFYPSLFPPGYLFLITSSHTRRRRRLRQQRNPSQSRTYPAPLDGQTMLPRQYRDPLPQVRPCRDGYRPRYLVPRREAPSASEVLHPSPTRPCLRTRRFVGHE